ncbi:DUF3034 family protein [Chitinimonas arctica]|uniref:DUF3034 family protein n=1 Tax=Chitinimonas arctica TaxID=2594795 RepID=A0A516SG03_9NEIS|nr:DUF3034 family protein [Chitinimonas arctica]QDQ27097.1 DUF3034 family protein [Chitinimonas arctica]
MLRNVALLLVLSVSLGTQAAGSRLPGTGGMSQLEGAAGGGLVPWALIAGYGSRDQVGGNAFVTRVDSQGFRLDVAGASVGLFDRVELSFARQRFGLGSTVPGRHLEQDIVGLKWKVYGDAVYDQDQAWPQLALGLMAKRNRDFSLPALLGAKHASDVEPYLAATKVWLDGPAGRSALLNGTLRYTRANQLGLLGFGGDRSDRRKLRLEASAAVFLTDALVLGLEYRQKNNNLSVFREQRFADVFLAWIPNRRCSLALAHAEMGNIADQPGQRGPYFSVKLDF